MVKPDTGEPQLDHSVGSRALGWREITSEHCGVSDSGVYLPQTKSTRTDGLIWSDTSNDIV